MEKIKIDLLKKKYRLDASQRRPFVVFGRTILSLAIFVAVAGAALSYQVDSSSDAGGFPRLSLFSTLKHLVGAGDRMLKGEHDDRVNFLLLGIGGEGHDGPQLTDTIIFASYQPSSDAIGMLSIPRDMAVPIPDEGWRKVNHANYFGEQKEPGLGPVLAGEVIGGLLDQEIHYYVRVDFAGFAKLVDDIGGVDIYVDRSFTDESYPAHGMEYADCGTTTDVEVAVDGDDGEATVETVTVPTYDCRFESLSFTEGWTHMDGETALKFVRSRHGSNGEGSDFARSRRQQKVIVAVKEKLMSAGTLLNPARLSRLMETLEDNVATNLTAWELIQLAGMLKDVDTSKIAMRVLDASEASPLFATSLNGAYVLLPKNDDWEPVREMAAGILEPTGSATATAGERPKFVTVEIQNGTTITGLAFRTSQLLEQNGYEVVKIGNAAERAYQHTVIYDLTDGEKPDELKALRDQLEAEVTMSATGWILSGDIVPQEISVSSDDYQSLATEDDVDFLVILGESSANVARN
jgi:LCP family protein required for cell wall assembly